MPLGVYIQVPFCQTKCTYCNFHTGVVSPDRFEPYARAVCREIPATALPQAFPATVVDTIYFGGGTPSLLDPAALTAILDALRAHYALAAPEITLEADPETISPEKAAKWLAAGFNRISLGVQSFHDRELQASGRMHRRADIFAATKLLRDAGFMNVSIDLIAGLPHQTHESWESSLSELLALRSEHVSIYLLEIDEGSRLGRESLAGGTRYSAAAIPSDDAQAEFYESACARLAAAGYDHYEISNWALPGHRSRHNLKYWRREPYLGLGAGAHSFDGQSRWANVHDSARYVELISHGASPREQLEAVSVEDALNEEIFLGLRQLDGIDLAAIERTYRGRVNEPLEARLASIRARSETLRDQGLVELSGDRLRLAPSRLAISNEVFVTLLD
jgi:oxygen-independent coproporphyrinogen III oxidase